MVQVRLGYTTRMLSMHDGTVCSTRAGGFV